MEATAPASDLKSVRVRCPRAESSCSTLPPDENMPISPPPSPGQDAPPGKRRRATKAEMLQRAADAAAQRAQDNAKAAQLAANFFRPLRSASTTQAAGLNPSLGDSARSARAAAAAETCAVTAGGACRSDALPLLQGPVPELAATRTADPTSIMAAGPSAGGSILPVAQATAAPTMPVVTVDAAEIQPVAAAILSHDAAGADPCGFGSIQIRESPGHEADSERAAGDPGVDDDASGESDSVYSFGGAELAKYLVDTAKGMTAGLQRVGFGGGSARTQMGLGGGPTRTGGRRLHGDLPSMWRMPPDPLRMGVVTPFHFLLQLVGGLCVWLPEFTYKSDFPEHVPPCPWCRNTACVRVKDALNPNGPRLVFAHDRVYWLWCARYICTVRKARQEQYCFNGYDPDVIAQLPNHIQLVFPAVLTHRKALDVAAVRSLDRRVISGSGGIAGLRRDMLEEQNERLHNLHEQYVSKVELNMHTVYANQQQRMPFPLPDDPEKIYSKSGATRGRFPSENWLTTVWLKYSDLRAPFLDRRMQMVDGTILAGDHSHKVPKLVFVHHEDGR